MEEDAYGHCFEGNALMIVAITEEEAERILLSAKGRRDVSLRYDLPVAFSPDAIYFKTSLTYYMARFHGYAWDKKECSFILHAFKPLYYATKGLLGYEIERHGSIFLCKAK